MKLGGLQKMTLLDFPGRVACTVFTVGCNFRCPFCHNSSLVVSPQAAELSQDAFFAFLKKRQGLLDGVAITGGEPVMHPDLPELMRRIRELGFAVKLDTNGSFPERLAAILEEGLADYVAMDIKNSREKYEQTAGLAGILPQVEQSVRLLMEGGTPFEFRTTLVDELHEPEDFTAIGAWIGGDEPYFIQGFVDSGDILAGGGRFHAADAEKAAACLEAAKAFLPKAQLRGYK
ncbi:MAG: anaerobic ribonucleoside-triphosphate reductase activating protein [Oscillospiraceae bacterium]|jgi:pyruvate formate lyase activating enzyme|nr:anaerobic ribonucleoside-triphosphate reductase activating protein [Oscillospiraceae bacterium]MBQ4191731.1 anaerobic ribonucleoside-triphosphate reductase activating protein [Bacteroidales bacterium]